MARGRPRKSGARYKSGKLRPVFDKGTERVQALRDRFGANYTTALGRAFEAGLLGEGNEAKTRLDVGNRFSRLYSALIQRGRYTCPLGKETRSTGSGGENTGTAHEQENENWLKDAMSTLDREGLRPWLDQLILDAYHDKDPPWLARLLSGGDHPADVMILDAAVKALDAIAPAKREIGIRVAHYGAAA